jgi:hypothetical protein
MTDRTENCKRGYHEDPDWSGQCIRCTAILDPLDEKELAEYEVRLREEEQYRADHPFDRTKGALSP